ncbi:MAG: CapA family protein [Clostridium sp.]|uniref:CapA family protein n=1 Tax=Enterocloster citroniae TaxID=358743 RepID=UPI00349E4F7B|nr:CapA family protein [Clostridium sp.]
MRRSWILAVVLVLGVLLSGITGYLIWHTVHNSYVKAEVMDGGPGASGNAGPADGAGQDSAGQDSAGLHGNQGAGGQGEGSRGLGGPEGFQDGRQDAGQGVEGLDNGGEEGSMTEDGGADPEPEDSTIRFVFAGDILLSDHVLAAYNKTGTIGSVVDQGLRDVIDGSDVFMANQEFPFSNRGSAAADKQFTFRLPPEKVSLLKEMGIDIVTLANNHALDFGTDALLDTCDTLDEAGIYRVGAGANLEEARKPVIMEIKGKTIGFLGASRVIPVGSWNATATSPGMLTTYDPAMLLEDIKSAKETCDFVIVYVHWGIERDEYPQDYQRTMGKQYIDAGADMVIGSHPHVLQGMEYYNSKPIVYSLGNFVFGSSIPKTALLTADWDGENLSLAFVPGTSSGGYTRPLTGEDEKQAFYQYLTGLSYGVVIDGEGCRQE